MLPLIITVSWAISAFGKFFHWCKFPIFNALQPMQLSSVKFAEGDTQKQNITLCFMIKEPCLT